MQTETVDAKKSAYDVLLIDGSSYLYRAFYASQKADLRTQSGFPTGAIRVIVMMLNALRKDYPESLMAVVFDAKGKNFRHTLYAEYKANRPPMPEDLRQQIQPIHQIIQAMGLPLLCIEGVEADDVIGTLARQAQQQQRHTLISTGDKDMAQLVGDYVQVIDTMKDVTLDRAGVMEKFGIAPEQIIDYLALMGDSSDNIPGIPKCGHKTAVKWLTAYGSVQALVAQAHEITGKIGENLRAYQDQLALSQQLATIKTDVALNVSIEALTVQSSDTQTLKTLFAEYEFRALLLQLDPNPPAKQPQVRYETITQAADFERWLARLIEAGCFAFDTETTSLDYMSARIVGVSFAIEPYVAAYVPLGHDYLGAPEQLPLEWVLARLKPILENVQIKKIGQHLKYDRNVLLNYDIHLEGIAFDTLLESYLLNAVATRHDMNSMAAYYLDVQTIHFEDIAGKGSKQLTFNQIDLAQAAPYAAEDADITLRLHQHIAPLLAQRPDSQRVLQEIEMPLLPILSDMERYGVLVDKGLLAQQSHSLQKSLADLEARLFAEVGEPFNINSPKQLGQILYETYGLPVLKKTPKGAPSTAEAVLQELAQDHPLVQWILDYRHLSKLKSTYTDKLPKMIHASTGRVHTSYHQAGTVTGRLSSSDPNLQNIPIRTAEGRKIRQAFIAPAGYCLIAADYSQIELRIMAHLSQDAGLLAAFSQDQDVHCRTASDIFGCALDQVSTEQRRSAKAINFGLIYGMSAFGLAKQLHCTRAAAQGYMDVYFERYPGVKRYMEQIKQQASEQGYVETLYGRRLYLPDLQASQASRRQGAERTAINAPMQGTAADIIKQAMIAVDRYLRTTQVDARLMMQVHDELVLEVAESQCTSVCTAIRSCMEHAVSLDVPLKVDIGWGANWDEAH